jgi:hypothetical protein
MREKGRKRIEGDGKKGGKRARRARKVTERKMSNKHSLEAGKLYISKGGKGEKSHGKKDGQYAFIRSRQG